MDDLIPVETLLVPVEPVDGWPLLHRRMEQQEQHAYVRRELTWHANGQAAFAIPTCNKAAFLVPQRDAAIAASHGERYKSPRHEVESLTVQPATASRLCHTEQTQNSPAAYSTGALTKVLSAALETPFAAVRSVIVVPGRLGLSSVCHE